MTDQEDYERRCQIAQDMLAMPEGARNAAMEAADNVHDLRPTLNHRRRQRELAAQYRSAFARKGPFA